MIRCAECHRQIVRTKPVYVGRVPFGGSCARRLGLVKPRTRRYAVATPRAMPDPAPEVLPGSVPLWTDEEGIDDDDGTD